MEDSSKMKVKGVCYLEVRWEVRLGLGEWESGVDTVPASLHAWWIKDESANTKRHQFDQIFVTSDRHIRH